jgi:hypothetical protein
MLRPRLARGAAAGLAAGLLLTGLLTVTGLPGASADAGCPAWSGQPPNPSSDPNASVDYRAAAVLGVCDVWAAGTIQHTSSIPFVEHWTGGSSWNAVPVPDPNNDSSISAISALTGSDLWVVGDTEAPSPTNPFASEVDTLAMHWNGTSWTQAPTQSPGGLGFDTFLGVAAVSSQDAWAVGYATNDDGTTRALIENWNGATWQEVPSPSPGVDVRLNAVTAVSANDIWAVGTANPSSDQTSDALIEHWDGHQWTVSSAGGAGDEFNDLFSVSAVSATDAWAVGDFTRSAETHDADISHTLTEHWDGHSWNVVPSPDANSAGRNDLLAVAALSATDVWASGASDNSSLELHWNGGGWSALNNSAPGTLVRVFSGPPAFNVWQFGEGGGTFIGQPLDGPALFGSPPVTVPNVAGLGDTAAQQAINAAGLTVGPITQDNHCRGVAGTVLSQSPAAGTTTAGGTPVSLTEASGVGGTGRPCLHILPG